LRTSISGRSADFNPSIDPVGEDIDIAGPIVMAVLRAMIFLIEVGSHTSSAFPNS